MAKATRNRRSKTAEPPVIGEIKVAGFKSIADEQKIEIRPYT